MIELLSQIFIGVLLLSLGYMTGLHAASKKDDKK